MTSEEGAAPEAPANEQNAASPQEGQLATHAGPASSTTGPASTPPAPSSLERLCEPVAALVGADKRLLLAGDPPASLAARLSERGCKVTPLPSITGSDLRSAERSALGNDLEDYEAAAVVDLLDRLASPVAFLRRCRRALSSSSVLVVAVRNATHGDHRLALLSGVVPDDPASPLGPGRSQRFTAASLRETLRDAGFMPVETRRVMSPLFHSGSAIRRDQADAPVVDRLLEDPDSETLWFVVRAVPDNGDSSVAGLARRVEILEERAASDLVRIGVLRAEATKLGDTRDALARSDAALAEARAQLEAIGTALARTEGQLRALLDTRTMRWTASSRRVYSSLLALYEKLGVQRGG